MEDTDRPVVENALDSIVMLAGAVLSPDVELGGVVHPRGLTLELSRHGYRMVVEFPAGRLDELAFEPACCDELCVALERAMMALDCVAEGYRLPPPGVH